MKKAIKILQKLKSSEKNYIDKVKLLGKILTNPTTGYICPDSLVVWCDMVGLKIECHCEDRTSWWTVSGR